MSELNTPTGAPEEVVTKALLREIDLAPFGFQGSLADVGPEHLDTPVHQTQAQGAVHLHRQRERFLACRARGGPEAQALGCAA